MKILAQCITPTSELRLMDKDRIFQKLKEIEESIALIREGTPSSALAFKRLGLSKDGIYKRLEFCIQNIIDIFSMIYSSLNLGVPSSLDDIFEGLRVHKVFSKEIIGLVLEMKGLRNILIHRYGKIDDSSVYVLITGGLDDLEKVACSIEKFVRK